MLSPSRGRPGERGTVALLAAVLVVVLLGLLGFVLNAGHATSVQGELENGTDAAALASARELNGRSSGITAARQAGRIFAGLHFTDTTRRVRISSTSDVRFCNWDYTDRQITWCLPWGTSPTTGPPPSPTPGARTQIQATNAVQVRDGREASRGNALPVWLSAFLGNIETLDARASATGVGGGPCETTRCLLPIAYLSGPLSGSGGVPCNSTIVFRDGNQDTAGFTNLTDSGGGVGNGQIQSILNAAVGGGACSSMSVDQVIDLKSGGVSDPTLWNTLRGIVGDEFSVPVVYSDTSRIKLQLPIIGFATVRITGVYRNAFDRPPPACRSGGTIVTPCIIATLACNQEVTAPAGCGLYGLAAMTSRLVQ